LVSHAGRFGFGAALTGSSCDGGRDASASRETDLVVTAGPLVGLYGVLVPGPTLLENPPEATRPRGAAMGLDTEGFAPGPIVLEKAFWAIDRVAIMLELTLRANIDGLAAGRFGAAALSERVCRFASGAFKPVSGSLRLGPPARWVVVRKFSAVEGAGPRIEGLLRIGESSGVGDVMRLWTIFSDLSPKGILDGDAIFEGCGNRDS
jgi:hypothetical protein